MKLTVYQCSQCDKALFPARYFCPNCGGAKWQELVTEAGKIEEVTVVRHRVGAEGSKDLHLATVRTVAGPVVIARLDRVMHVGDAVQLQLDSMMRVLGHAGHMKGASASG